MPNGRVYARGKLTVAHDRTVLCSAPLFKLKHIFAVLLKLHTAVGGHTLTAFLFKGCGESLSLFLALFSVHVGDTLKVAV